MVSVVVWIAVTEGGGGIAGWGPGWGAGGECDEGVLLDVEVGAGRGPG